MSDGHHPTEVTEQKVAKYLDTTTKARKLLRPLAPSPSWLEDVSKDYLRMADSYIADAKAFMDKGDRVLAFACLNYAHGWLDAGARLGLWDVAKNEDLFTLKS